MLYDEEEGKKQLGDKYEENQDHGTVGKVQRVAFLAYLRLILHPRFQIWQWGLTCPTTYKSLPWR